MDLARTWIMLTAALIAYLSDMPEADKLAAVQAACADWATYATVEADMTYGEPLDDTTILFGA